MARVLVTGGSAFVGEHVILALLAAGHEVRATIRAAGREAGVRAALAGAGVESGDRLTFILADLEHDAGWAAAAAGCDYVQHVASPFPLASPRDEEDLIRPARDGTLRVLRAAAEAGVRRVVVTSSFAAIGYGHAERATPLTEDDWTDPAGADVMPYFKSKTLAERAAWDFFAATPGAPELATVCPVAIFGPALDRHLSSSVEIVRMMMRGRMPLLPDIWFGAVDVRDVADLHLRAMTDPAAAGERFLAVAGPSVSLAGVAAILRAGLGRAARRVSTRRLPDGLIRFGARFVPPLRPVAANLGLRRNATATKAERLLSWVPRPAADAIVASGESLVRLGSV